MRELQIKALLMDKENKAPFVLLQDRESRKVMPIWIGVYEAMAISYELQGRDFSRPLTHDLLNTLLDELADGLEKVVINDLRDRTYYASLFVKKKGSDEVLEIDARPSDSITMALKANAPIYISDKIFDIAAIQSDENMEKEEREEFQRFVEELDIKDFKKFSPED